MGIRRRGNPRIGGRPPPRTVRALSVALRIPEELLEGEELAHRREEGRREARTAPLPDELDPRVRDAIGVEALYVHQRAAWEAAARGEHLVVTTGTASGKTLAFNLPVLDSLVRTPRNRVLYLYPTKALAQDQFRTLNALRVPKLRPAIYDGDTPTEQRRQIRKWANAILTNPDMVHIGLLPNHERWGDVLSNLALRRRRRGARLPRDLRLARRERAAATAADRPDLRLRPAVPARDGDDRESRASSGSGSSASPSP